MSQRQFSAGELMILYPNEGWQDNLALLDEWELVGAIMRVPPLQARTTAHTLWYIVDESKIVKARQIARLKAAR